MPMSSQSKERVYHKLLLKEGQWTEHHSKGEKGAGWICYKCPACGASCQVPPGVHILRTGEVDRILTCHGCDRSYMVELDKWDGGHRVKLFMGNEANLYPSRRRR